MNSLKADFFSEEKVNLPLSNSEQKSDPPRVLLTHYNVITLLVLILFAFLTFTNNAFSQPMKSLYEQIIQDNNLSFITVTRTSNQITLKINYTNLNYSIDSTENGWYINMESFCSSGIQGAPDLPYRAYTLELPANVIFSSINTTIDSIYPTAAGNYTPFKPVIQTIDTIVYDEPDEIIYNTDAYYPYNPINISSPTNMRNWVFIGFGLYPFQYNPVTGNLLKVDSIEFVINFEVSRDSIPIDSTKVPGYCIITTQAIKDRSAKLEEFRLSKERIGFDCFVVTVDSLDNCNFSNLQAPGERPERIRRYLKENYIEKNIEYSLLIGNPKPKNPFEPNKEVGDVPMKYILTHINANYKENYWKTKEVKKNKYSTDYYYADLTGNWDLDGDEFYGESCLNYCFYNQYPPGITNDTFSIKYEGWIIIPYNTNTTPPSIYKGNFFATYNDGFRLWINDTLCNNTNINSKYYFSDSNSWSDNIEGYGYTSPDTSNFFRSGDTLKIKIEYYNKKNNYFLRFYYRGYSETNTIPNTWFFCGDSIQNSAQGGLKANYYNNLSLYSTPAEIQFIKGPNLTLDIGDQGENGVDFLPEVQIGRVPVYDYNYCVLD
ncbi:MAG TPA: C25 family cysteine peptidase [Candidatus Kapabacteria bacterium]|nr:C25 family cysteine peptidase [Candidatus Kapabacteria bacterium]